MDEMNLMSKMMNKMVSKVVKKAIKSKLGYDLDIQLNQLKANFNDGETSAHIDVDIKISKEQLTKLIKEFGLGIELE